MNDCHQYDCVANLESVYVWYGKVARVMAGRLVDGIGCLGLVDYKLKALVPLESVYNDEWLDV